MKKLVYKYGTGMEIPKGAVYLTTLVEEIKANDFSKDVRLVWHYFLVEVE